MFTVDIIYLLEKKCSICKSYSARKKGGGVILDLSHEIDYIKYIFGKKKIKLY